MHAPPGTGTETYYRQRANEYDKVYAKPERQPNLRSIETWLATAFDARRVLEIAAGTGYWTQFYADAARRVVATDVNSAVLDIAASRREWPDTVRFETASAFELDDISGSFDAAFAGFFWSHLLLEHVPRFLDHLAPRLEPGSRIIFIDNRYVDGSNHPITSTDAAGNTSQRRRLDDGSEWDVLKNFPTPAELETRLARIAATIDITEHDYYWIADITTG